MAMQQRTTRRRTAVAAMSVATIMLAAPCPLRAIEHPSPIPANSLPAGRSPLSLRQAVTDGLRNHFPVRIQALETEIGAIEVDAARSAFLPVFELGANVESSQQPLNTREFLATGEDTLSGPNADSIAGRLYKERNVVLSSKLAGRMPWGSTYEASLDQRKIENSLNRDIPPSLFYPEFGSRLGITFTQPLLKGAGPGAGLAELRIARLESEKARLDEVRSLEDTALAVVRAQHNLASAYQNLEVKRDSIRLAKQLETENRRRMDAGLMSSTDVSQAQSAAAARYDEYRVGYAALLESLSSLRTLISGDLSDVRPPPFYEPLPSPRTLITEDMFDWKKAAVAALDRRTEIRIASLEVEKAGLRLRYARNQALPRVDLKTGAGVNALDDSFGSSLGEISERQGPFWTVGVVASMPLGRGPEHAAREQERLRQREAVLVQAQARQKALIELDQYMHLTRNERERVAEAARNVDATADVLAAETALLERGLSTSYQVLELQNQLSEARTRSVLAAAELEKAIAGLDWARGVLLENLGFTLELGDPRAVPSPMPKPSFSSQK